MLIKLYKCFVRPRPMLEYASVVFLHHISLIDLIENVLLSLDLQKDYMICIIFVLLIDLNYVI